MPRRRAVITGLGVITSLGKDVQTMWDGVCAGRSGIVQVRRFDAARYPCHIGGELTDFDPTEYMNSKQARRVDRVTQFALIAAREAVENSGLDFSKEDPFRAGVIVGSGIGGAGRAGNPTQTANEIRSQAGFTVYRASADGQRQCGEYFDRICDQGSQLGHGNSLRFRDQCHGGRPADNPAR